REDARLEWIFLPRKPNRKLKTYIEKISDLIHKGPPAQREGGEQKKGEERLQPLADRGTPPSPPKLSLKQQTSPWPPENSPSPRPGAASHPQRKSHSQFLGPRSSQSPSEEESFPRTQEQPVTLRGRGTRNSQSSSEEDDQGTSCHPQRKRIWEHPETIGIRHVPCPPTKAEMGRHQWKSTHNNIKNNTSPESSPPPTPRPEHCNVDKSEENDLKNSLMKMIEEDLEGKMKNSIKEIEENTNKKLEEINKEIKEKNKKIKRNE
ncbi:hypothetical protein STEG23_033279, partial [Scotinomys teguina]